MFGFSLLILGNNTEFERGVSWLSENLSFDVDARVNLFEVRAMRNKDAILVVV